MARRKRERGGDMLAGTLEKLILILALHLPARSATKTGPVVALRYEQAIAIYSRLAKRTHPPARGENP